MEKHLQRFVTTEQRQAMRMDSSMRSIQISRLVKGLSLPILRQHMPMVLLIGIPEQMQLEGVLQKNFTTTA